jgi:acetyl-CoA C-acetyltransferase
VELNDAVIVSTARTPIGRAHKGSLIDVPAVELAEVALRAAVERSGIPPTHIDDVLFAEAHQGGGVTARHIALRLGMTTTPGVALNRHCAGSLTAVSMAAASIRSGMESVVVAGGVESMSTRPEMLRDGEPWKPLSHPPDDLAPPTDMSITVGENTARLAGASRADADAWACRRISAPSRRSTRVGSWPRWCRWGTSPWTSIRGATRRSSVWRACRCCTRRCRVRP